jgi:hypothetical protein
MTDIVWYWKGIYKTIITTHLIYLIYLLIYLFKKLKLIFLNFIFDNRVWTDRHAPWHHPVSVSIDKSTDIVGEEWAVCSISIAKLWLAHSVAL